MSNLPLEACLTRPLRSLAVALALAALVASPAAAQSEETWKAIRGDVVGERPLASGDGIVSIEAPYRANDAAIVPIDVAAHLPDGRTVKAMTLVIDENPSPVAATFTFGQPRADLALSTRVRINSYSYVRAIVEADDGTLYMTARYVKASGGCSAPALKDEDDAFANLGKMKVRYPAPAEAAATPVTVPGATGGQAAVSTAPLRAQIMIRHPNYSGLQMNQLTQLYIPARFVNDIEVRQGGETLLTMEGGISLSEDPTVAFEFVPNGADVIEVRAKDTDGKVFSGAFPIEAGRS
jgi:sulfur-oxidizing protein SoxY